MRNECERHLTKKLLPFWKKLRDEEYGGFYGWMDSELRVDPKAVKGCILNSRILWFFSNAALALPQDATLRGYADHAYEFFKEYCLDREWGGVYWSVRYDGSPEDDTKHTYNQAFAVYALSAYYRAFGVMEALKLASGLVDLIEGKCFDEGGYLEAQDRSFHPVDNDKLSENGVMADRTMNTLLHVLEAYTEYYLACGQSLVQAGADQEAAQDTAACQESVRAHRGLAGRKLSWMLDLFASKVYNPQKRRQEVFFDKEMHSLIDLHSYGHDIETAWLVDRCLDALKDEALTERLSPILRSLEAQVYEDAFDGHSLANECERGVVDEKRVWWVQAEGVVGFYNAYQKTGQERYLAASESIFKFIQEHVVDGRVGGEWFWYTSRQGEPAWDKPIVEPWKCPYHNGRMCMEVMRRESPVGQTGAGK